MLTLIERPEPWSFSRNFIRYRFLSSLTFNLAPEIQVRLYVGATDGTGDKLVTMYSLTPDATGNAELYVEDLIDAYLVRQMPLPVAGAITPVTTQSASYYIEYREVSIINASPPWVSDITTRCRALKAGLPADLFNRSLPTQFSVLTYQAGYVARVAVTDHFYRTFVSFSVLQTTSRNAVLDVIFSDGYLQRTVLAFVPSAFNIFHVPASPAAWGIVLTAGKIPVTYQVRIEEITNSLPVNTVLIDAVIDHHWYSDVYSFQYHNSLGGLDFLRLLGDVDIENERTFTEGESILSADWNQVTRKGMSSLRGPSVQRTMKGDAGYFLSPEEQDVIQELDFSESVWQLKKLSATVNQWYPIRIVNKSRKLRSVSSKRWNYEVEFQPAFASTAFSNLPYAGLGVDTNVYPVNVCGLVTGLAVTISVSNGFHYADLTWLAGLNARGYRIQFREVGSGPWPFEFPLLYLYYSFNVEVGKTYEWQVNTSCSDTQNSAYVAGPTFTV